jgi:glycosyltransferase involved in cell wall biosynthesis
VLFTLTRLSSSEQYKGYDKVIEVVAQLVKEKPNLKYLIGGKGDLIEVERIETLIKSYHLENQIQLLGFIKEEELANHFLVADNYIMPSHNEGFGIVFIEAAFYGLPVIAGNIDGSSDALLDGKLGELVNPDSKDEIKRAILKSISRPKKDQGKLHHLTQQNFNFYAYSKRFIRSISFNQ